MTTTTEKESTWLPLPPLIEKHLDFSVWLLYKVRKFDKDLRFTIGNHISALCLSVTNVLVGAYYGNKGNGRIQSLHQAQLYIEELRINLRMCFMLGLMPAASLLYAARCLKEEAKMIQGWLNTENAHV